MTIDPSDPNRPDINRLLKTLHHQEADRLPHIELWVTSQEVYEYVLERKLLYSIGDAAEGGQSITPEDDVEFAQRLGQDVVLCNFNWRPNNIFKKAADGTRHYVDGSIKTSADLENLEPPTPGMAICSSNAPPTCLAAFIRTTVRRWKLTPTPTCSKPKPSARWPCSSRVTQKPASHPTWGVLPGPEGIFQRRTA